MTKKQLKKLNVELGKALNEDFNIYLEGMTSDERFSTMDLQLVALVYSYAITTECPYCTASLLLDEIGEHLKNSELPQTCKENQ